MLYRKRKKNIICSIKLLENVCACVCFRPLWILRSFSLLPFPYFSFNACFFTLVYRCIYSCLCMDGFLVVNFFIFIFSFHFSQPGVKSICRVFSSLVSMKFFFVIVVVVVNFDVDPLRFVFKMQTHV